MADEKEKTPTDVLIELLEDVDDVTQALIVYRRADQTIGYKTAGQHFADSFGLLRFAQLSMENDLINSWKD